MASSSINNPARILQTLDSHLEKDTTVVLFGRAALALGFGESGAQFGKTQDVDAILPTIEMAKIEADTQFWNAIDRTNKDLSESGLYVSHLFTDRQIALTANWLEKIVPIPAPEYRFLHLFRPAAVDFILTKMMRNDKEDLEDIRFILSQDRVSPADLDVAFASAAQLEIPELQEIFVKMQPVVRSLAETFSPADKTKATGKAFESPKRSLLEEIADRAVLGRTPSKDRGLER